MNITINEMTINNEIVKGKLVEYLDKIKTYQNFDSNMMLRVFVNNDLDFTAFEAVDYRIQFTSHAHKIIETITSAYKIPLVPFSTFYDAVLSLKK